MAVAVDNLGGSHRPSQEIVEKTHTSTLQHPSCTQTHIHFIALRIKARNLKTDQEQFIRSNGPTARPLISVRRAES